jgi:dTDP-4-amino-4,6-dideoxygalactose transaminase
VLSFHATKVFNTFEGGAIVCQDEKTKRRIDYLKNFGFADEVTVIAPGINGKMNELQAAFGLLQLRHIDLALTQRRRIFERYSDRLAGVRGISLMNPPANVEWNYAYCPIMVDGEQFGISRDDLYERFRAVDILVRRYFYPLICEFPMYRGLESANLERLRNAQRTSRQVLCLPIYPDLDIATQDRILSIILDGAGA